MKKDNRWEDMGDIMELLLAVETSKIFCGFSLL